jgi:coproporphyrinogen III oxidase
MAAEKQLPDLDEKKRITANWFRDLRDKICTEFENIEGELGCDKPTGRFERKTWQREGGGGGEISLMKNGRVFEKVGVNISTVHGKFSEEFAKQIPGAEENPEFFATGVSLVAHMNSPLIPAVHMNTRFIVTTKSWFGGGSDLNPIFEVAEDTADFHAQFKQACDKHDPEYYAKFKHWCDEYFFIKHRNESRGVGGIFYDYINSGNWENDLAFTQDVGKAFLKIYPEIVRRHLSKAWTEEQRQQQLLKRGRYAEFNLMYDRGTKFGLMTGGNVEAILMSMPPLAKWE